MSVRCRVEDLREVADNLEAALDATALVLEDIVQALNENKLRVTTRTINNLNSYREYCENRLTRLDKRWRELNDHLIELRHYSKYKPEDAKYLLLTCIGRKLIAWHEKDLISKAMAFVREGLKQINHCITQIDQQLSRLCSKLAELQRMHNPSLIAKIVRSVQSFVLMLLGFASLFSGEWISGLTSFVKVASIKI